MTPRAALTIFLLIVNLRAEDVLPPEALAARKRYDADVQAAMRPIRERYVWALENAKKSAIARSDLKAANLIAAELDRVSGAIDPKDPKAVLCGYWWSSHSDKWEFSPDGTLIQLGTGWGGKTWKFSPDQKSVELIFFNDVHHTYAFKNGVLIHFDPAWGAFQKTLKQ